jgi:glucoamylase
MRAKELPHERGVGRELDLRDAALLVAGVAVIGGTLLWARNGSRDHRRRAPGRPGAPPRWSFASKDGVGTALGPSGPSGSRVWFTLRDGAFTEIFYPRADQPAVSGLGLVVTDSRGYYSEETRDADHETSWLDGGVPAYRLTNTCRRGRYRIVKTVLAHPGRDAVLQATRFEPLVGTIEDYRVFALLSPQLGDRGGGNTAWVGECHGVPMLFAERAGHALALACSVPWAVCSAGFLGSVSDGRRDLRRHGRLTRTYERAEDGNVGLIAGIDLRGSTGGFTLALGFGGSPAEAALHARASLLDDFGAVRDEYVRGWRAWQQPLSLKGPPGPDGHDLSAISTAVLRSHEDKAVPGAVIASLANPWGQSRGDDKSGPVGYHLVWPRDLVEVAGAFVAVGARADAVRVLRYLRATQEGDGHWPQNQWVDGKTGWTSNQMGETALPILLMNLMAREGVLGADDLERFWPMARAAAAYIARSGPSSQEDRWEDARGFTPFTLSALVAALLVASEFANANGETGVGAYLRETADAWYDAIDHWTYVEGTGLAREAGVRGYYLRIAPPDDRGEPSKRDGDMRLWYRPAVEKGRCPARIVSVDALAYVRFGLRAADDPRILDTVRVIDADLKVETPNGPAWHRYSHDGYGEKEDGSPFDGERGVGRAWPLLTGERAHYELAADRRDEAARLMRAIEAFAGPEGMIPEQVWDSDDIPEKGLFLGRPTGSAMPLAWAHAEYLKLRRSLADGRVFDTPPQTVRRYLRDGVTSPHVIWRTDHRRRAIPAGKLLRVEVREPAIVRWDAGGSAGGEVTTRDTGLGVHVADLSTAGLRPGCAIRFTLSGPEGDPTDHHVDDSNSVHSVNVE